MELDSEQTNSSSSYSSFDPNDISDNFWEIIRKTDNSRNILEKILMEEDKDNIYKFAGEFTEAAIQLNDSPFLDYLEDLSEDETQDICYWIVSQGKDLYQNIWNSPELISTYQEVGDRETLFGVAESVYEDKFKEEMPELYDKFGYPVFYAVNLG